MIKLVRNSGQTWRSLLTRLLISSLMRERARRKWSSSSRGLTLVLQYTIIRRSGTRRYDCTTYTLCYSGEPTRETLRSSLTMPLEDSLVDLYGLSKNRDGRTIQDGDVIH